MNTPLALGTYVDGWWGVYAPARALLVAHELRAPVPPEGLALARQELASAPDNPNTTDPLTFDQHEILTEHLDEAESWLNTHRTWPDRTSWYWTDGAWGHYLWSPHEAPRPQLRFYAEIYSHDTDPTGPEDAIDSGYFDPNWSSWHPIPDSNGHPGWELDLLDLTEGNYNPDHFATTVADQARRWTGHADHIDTTETTVIVYPSESVDDLGGSRGTPLATYWALRQAHIVGLTPYEAERIADRLNTNP